MKAAVSVLSMCLLLVSCGDELSVEQQVIATLRNMEDAAEQGQHLEFMGFVADTFSAQDGTMDRRDFHRFMIFQINQNRRLQAQLFPVSVRQGEDSRASAYFKLLVTGGGGLLPDNGQLFEVETFWIQQGGDWLLDEANWEPVRLQGT